MNDQLSSFRDRWEQRLKEIEGRLQKVRQSQPRTPEPAPGEEPGTPAPRMTGETSLTAPAGDGKPAAAPLSSTGLFDRARFQPPAPLRPVPVQLPRRTDSNMAGGDPEACILLQQQEIFTLRQQIKETQERLEKLGLDARQEREHLSGIVRSLEKHLDAAEHEKAELERNYAREVARTQLLQEKADFLQKEMDTRSRKDDQVTLLQREYQQTLKSKEDEISRLFKRVDELENGTLHEQVRFLQAEIETRSKKDDQLLSLNKEYQDGIRSREDEIRRLFSRSETLEKECANLAAGAEAAARERAEISARLETLSRERDELASRIEDLSRERDEFSARNASLENERREQGAQIAALEQECARLTNEANALRTPVPDPEEIPAEPEVCDAQPCPPTRRPVFRRIIDWLNEPLIEIRKDR